MASSGCCGESKAPPAVSSGCCGGKPATGAEIQPDSASNVHDSVKDYYGKRLQSSDDLQTSACTTFGSSMPLHIRQAIGDCHDEVVTRYYGCGLVVPEALRGAHILDLGSGAGRDCFVLSKLVGPEGRVVGVDMTEEQLVVARRHIDYHTEKFGYSKPNVEFRFGYIEKLGEAGLEDDSFDAIVSNCVVNLVPDKEAVLREAHRVLRVGGELYFSDVYASELVPESLRRDAVLWGECISGALYWQDLVDIAIKVGFARPHLVRAAPIEVNNPEQQAKLGNIKFVSATYRLFKPAPGKTDGAASCVTYNGGIENVSAELEFDAATTFHVGKPTLVTAQTGAVLKESRFSSFLTIKESSDGSQPDQQNLNPFDLSRDAPSAPGGGCCAEKPADKNSCGQEKRPADGCCGSESAPKKKCCWC